MTFVLTEDQEMLRDTAMNFTRDELPVKHLRTLRDSGKNGVDPDARNQLAELGFFGVLIPEEYDGVGMGMVALGQVMEAQGRTLASTPLLQTACIGASAILLGGTEAQKKEWLPKIASGEISIKDKREILEGIWAKTKRQTLKDYVAFPLLAGPFAPWVFTGNLTANLIRNVWSYMIIFCGHFPEDVQEFTIEETKAESRGQWYFRQILGSANLTGGKLFHILSGNLSFQIEHHLFPDIPAHRHAEISESVREICGRYGIPYNTGPLPRQFATVVRKIVRLALPWT